MARDVPKDQAEVLLTGTNARGKRIERYLDSPPKPADLRGLTTYNIQLLRVITRAAVDKAMR